MWIWEKVGGRRLVELSKICNEWFQSHRSSVVRLHIHITKTLLLQTSNKNKFLFCYWLLVVTWTSKPSSLVLLSIKPPCSFPGPLSAGLFLLPEVLPSWLWGPGAPSSKALELAELCTRPLPIEVALGTSHHSPDTCTQWWYVPVSLKSYSVAF